MADADSGLLLLGEINRCAHFKGYRSGHFIKATFVHLDDTPDQIHPLLFAALRPRLERSFGSRNTVVRISGIPQPTVGATCDLFFHHGGLTSATEALAAAVPSLVIPYYWDRHEIARQIEDAGLEHFLARSKVKQKLWSE